MIYADGYEARIGDEVAVDCDAGIVVALLSDGVFSSAYPKADWDYLKTGLLYISERTGLTLIEDIGEVRLLRRTDAQQPEVQKTGPPHAA
jgi:hypothetical protein